MVKFEELDISAVSFAAMAVMALGSFVWAVMSKMLGA